MFFTTLLAIIFSVITYVLINNFDSPLSPTSNTIIGLVLIDLILLLILALSILYKIILLWRRRKKRSVGSKLQSRVILMFATVTVIPTIMISIFSTLFFNYGIQSWFNDKISTALDGSVIVAKGYLHEHNNSLSIQIRAMIADINTQSQLFYYDNNAIHKFLDIQTVLRDLTEAVIFTPNSIIARSRLSFSLGFDSIPSEAIKATDNNEVVVFLSNNYNKVRALVKLKNHVDTYLVIGKLIDAKVLQHLRATQGAVDSYKDLEKNISSLQIQFSIMFSVVSFLLLLAAIWSGIMLSGEIVNPIINLVIATKRVAEGNLNIRVEEGKSGEEMTTLAISFNRMTQQIQLQHEELKKINFDIDKRRLFIEAILSGVSSGIIAVNQEICITLLNASAKSLLNLSDDVVDSRLETIIPDMYSLVNKCIIGESNIVEDQIIIILDNRYITLLVRVTALNQKSAGFIITFDDISELVLAQKLAAWSDVARNIAHEIKNPVTPIYLAAERLNKKYLSMIPDESKVDFNNYINTIMKQVNNISHIIDEFANFARMPAPKIMKCDICQIIRNISFSGQFSNNLIKYKLSLPDHPIYIMGDEGQISQVLINIFKNSHDVINSEVSLLIHVSAHIRNSYVNIIIEDNGSGFPPELIGKIMNPYVTNKKNGTGLGLAIVKKIIIEHNGNIKVYNSDNGAVVQFALPVIRTNEYINLKN